METISGIAGDFRVRNIPHYHAMSHEQQHDALRRTARMLRFQAQDLEIEAMAMEIEALAIEQGVVDDNQG